MNSSWAHIGERCNDHSFNDSEHPTLKQNSVFTSNLIGPSGSRIGLTQQSVNDRTSHCSVCSIVHQSRMMPTPLFGQALSCVAYTDSSAGAG